MEDIYWIQEWAKLRQNEVVRLPENFEIHDCFLKHIKRDDFELAFKEMWNIYINIYGDIADFPERFGMPLYKRADYKSFTVQERESRSAPYRPLKLLFNLLISGNLESGNLIIDTNAFKAVNDVKNVHNLFERLSDYGFLFEGLKNFKVTKQNIIVIYPDNANVLVVLKLMADKANKTNRLNDFLCCHYKLFQDDMNTVNYGYGADIVADKMHTEQEKQFIYSMDAVLREKGYLTNTRGWNEGPGYAYYEKESDMKTRGPYHYLMLSWKTKLVLYLRIRNASKCLEYLEQCPDTVKQMFLWSDNGCNNRRSGTCKMGQEYTIDGNTYWKCGCCNAPFHCSPNIEDISHYIKLVEIGLRK
jgi:hypothetical protein